MSPGGLAIVIRNTLTYEVVNPRFVDHPFKYVTYCSLSYGDLVVVVGQQEVEYAEWSRFSLLRVICRHGLLCVAKDALCCSFGASEVRLEHESPVSKQF